MKTDVEIAQSAKLLPIEEIASKLDLSIDDLDLYGKYKAKVNLAIDQDKKQGNLILVSAMTPTKAGEGKSTTTVGLVDGLNALGLKACGALREPSLGPVFGIKGGATGGGYAQVVPMVDINLHFTGDLHAITTCNNLVAAVIDNHIFQGNELGIDVNRVLFKRCIDLNDRALRKVTVAQGKNETPRLDGFNITVASEIMAIFCLAKDLEDFKRRADNILIAYSINNEPIYLKALKITGSLAAIIRDALKPNLVQTLEHSPVFIHGGPFANIAHGCNSIIATKTALQLADYVVTEAGFGVDLGAEKFLDIKCRLNNLKPKVVVVVATIRALKLCGGVEYQNLSLINMEALKAGLKNLEKHLDTINNFGLPKVIALNKFSSDQEIEIEYLKNWAKENKVALSVSEGWEKGGRGMLDLAKQVVDLCEEKSDLKFIYGLEETITEKIEKIVKKVYGGNGVVYSDQALADIKSIETNGWINLPICMAKTQNSLTDNPKQVTWLDDFKITISKITPSLGAGFLVVHTGSIMTMPGLGKEFAAEQIDVVDGKIVGMF